MFVAIADGDEYSLSLSLFVVKGRTGDGVLVSDLIFCWRMNLVISAVGRHMATRKILVFLLGLRASRVYLVLAAEQVDG